MERRCLEIASILNWPRLGVFVLLALPWLGGGVFAFPKVPARDRYGAWIPDGAVARFGTDQLRAGTRSIAFAPDGQTLLGADDLLFRHWSAVDGRLLKNVRRRVPENARTEMSADGRTLLMLSGTTMELWDVASMSKLSATTPSVVKSIDCVAVANDRKTLLLAESLNVKKSPNPERIDLANFVYRLTLVDIGKNKATTISENEVDVIWLGFSSDSSRAVSSGKSGTRVWDSVSGKLLWEVPNYNVEEAQFTLDGKYLIAAPGGGQSHWHIWDAQTGKPVQHLRPPTGYVWMFAVSPDGTQLLLPTESDYVLWDMKIGRERRRWPGANQSGRGAISPDGKSVLTYDTILRRWDIATGKNLYEDVDRFGHVAPVRRILFTPAGKHLVSIGDDRTIRVWDVATTKLLRTHRIAADTIDAWALGRDGATLYGIDANLTVHSWPLESEGRSTRLDLREAQKLDLGLRARDMRMAQDGSLAILVVPRVPTFEMKVYNLSFWNLATGKLLRWGGDLSEEYSGEHARFSADATWIVAGDPPNLFDTKLGLKRALPASPIGATGVPVFSPDGRFVAAGGAALRIWEVATARVFADLPRGTGFTDQTVFSADGRRVATRTVDKLVIWDMPTGANVAEWRAPEFVDQDSNWFTGGFAFAPDGRTIAAGFRDGTILLRHLPRPKANGQWSVADAEQQWYDIGAESPAIANAAVWALAEHPHAAVPFLKHKYPLAPAVQPGEWTKLIAALDSAKFTEREAASKRLGELGRAAAVPLRQALANKPSPEQARRIETLLAELDPTATRPRGDDLRAVRAVAVVECCATRDARQLLADWSQRGPTPRLAEEAARALDRLKRRP